MIDLDPVDKWRDSFHLCIMNVPSNDSSCVNATLICDNLGQDVIFGFAFWNKMPVNDALCGSIQSNGLFNRWNNMLGFFSPSFLYRTRVNKVLCCNDSNGFLQWLPKTQLCSWERSVGRSGTKCLDRRRELLEQGSRNVGQGRIEQREWKDRLSVVSWRKGLGWVLQLKKRSQVGST